MTERINVDHLDQEVKAWVDTLSPAEDFHVIGALIHSLRRFVQTTDLTPDEVPTFLNTVVVYASIAELALRDLVREVGIKPDMGVHGDLQALLTRIQADIREAMRGEGQ